jgi:hypothetical protein
MKTKTGSILMAAGLALVLFSGCAVYPDTGEPVDSPYVDVSPTPVVVEPVGPPAVVVAPVFGGGYHGCHGRGCRR